MAFHAGLEFSKGFAPFDSGAVEWVEQLRAVQPKLSKFAESETVRESLYYTEKTKGRKTIEQRFQNRMRARGGRRLLPESRPSRRVVFQLPEEVDPDHHFWRTPSWRLEGGLEGRRLYGVTHRPRRSSFVDACCPSFGHRRVSAGEKAAAGLSRMAGAGAFPSPIAHVSRRVRVCRCGGARPKPKCLVGNFNAYGKEGPMGLAAPRVWRARVPRGFWVGLGAAARRDLLRCLRGRGFCRRKACVVSCQRFRCTERESVQRDLLRVAEHPCVSLPRARRCEEDVEALLHEFASLCGDSLANDRGLLCGGAPKPKRGKKGRMLSAKPTRSESPKAARTEDVVIEDVRPEDPVEQLRAALRHADTTDVEMGQLHVEGRVKPSRTLSAKPSRGDPPPKVARTECASEVVLPEACAVVEGVSDCDDDGETFTWSGGGCALLQRGR